MELKEYILPLRRWWWLIIASTLVAVVASFLATRQQAPIYQTHTTLMIGNAIEKKELPLVVGECHDDGIEGVGIDCLSQCFDRQHPDRISH